MLPGLRVSEPFRKAEIDNVDIMLLLADSDEEVVRFDVSVKEVARVYKLNSLKLY